uniref:Gluzincin n=1 Tax=Rhipicephalus zambeziensis TaxID=60191 RepID=A0A224YD63_9ACAR
MTHGFDDQGSQYDEGGALKQWWSNKTRTEFINRTKCFEEEFGNITDRETNMTLNGKNTVGENIADSGGLRLAFEAFKHLLDLEYRNVDTRLKGMENVTGKQLFFISNAMTWCSLSRPEYLKVLIQYDPHSPAPYRVNVPMSNMEGFSEAFGCSVNSTMNRKHRCSLW